LSGPSKRVWLIGLVVLDRALLKIGEQDAHVCRF